MSSSRMWSPEAALAGQPSVSAWRWPNGHCWRSPGEIGGAAARHLSQARSLAREANLADYPPITIVHAVAARVALHEADRPRAVAELTRAQRLRPALTYAVPHLAVPARIELARCHLALSDVARSRELGLLDG